MTLRERIADWISGGALSHARWQAQRLGGFAKTWHNAYTKAYARLDRIAAQETPGANATVRRMARIARGEE